MAASELLPLTDAPQQIDLDRCVHCGLCLNACPTYRELGLEMDSPRGRIYQMVQVSNGAAPMTRRLCASTSTCAWPAAGANRPARRACSTAGWSKRRAPISKRSASGPGSTRSCAALIFRHLLPSRAAIRIAARLLWLYQRSGMQQLVRSTGLLDEFGDLGKAERLAPPVETPFFYDQLRPRVSGRRRAAVPRGAARRLHRERVLRAAERGHACAFCSGTDAR